MYHCESGIPFFIFSIFSDGAGRSGVYIAIDANIELCEEDGVFDVYGYLKKIRGLRRGLVETLVGSIYLVWVKDGVRDYNLLFIVDKTSFQQFEHFVKLNLFSANERSQKSIVFKGIIASN